MHIGILGTGFGKYHGELYKKIDPTIHLTFLGRNVEKLQKIQSELNCDYTTDMNEFLENDTFDFIDICLPSQIHAEYAFKALKKNHSIFLETPAVTSIEDGIKIMELAKKTGNKVFVNMFLLYDPYYRMIYNFSKSKKVASDITTNSDNSGAIIDCLLSNNSLKVHVQGNSMNLVLVFV